MQRTKKQHIYVYVPDLLGNLVFYVSIVDNSTDC